jgi:carboxymethylenebutenolidase
MVEVSLRRARPVHRGRRWFAVLCVVLAAGIAPPAGAQDDGANVLEGASMTVEETQGYLALPKAGSGPGVLVLHAWWGLNPFLHDVCDRLAKEGFVVYAPDLYRGERATTIAEAERLSDALDHERVRADVRRAIDRLRDIDAVTGSVLGVVGFSLGAMFALGAANDHADAIDAVVVFYGTGAMDTAATRAAYMGHFAESDEFEPASGVAQLEQSLRAAGRPVTFHIYPGTGHWFFEKDRPDAYDARAAKLAWKRTVAFLNSTLRVATVKKAKP